MKKMFVKILLLIQNKPSNLICGVVAFAGTAMARITIESLTRCGKHLSCALNEVDPHRLRHARSNWLPKN